MPCRMPTPLSVLFGIVDFFVQVIAIYVYRAPDEATRDPEPPYFESTGRGRGAGLSTNESNDRSHRRDLKQKKRISKKPDTQTRSAKSRAVADDKRPKTVAVDINDKTQRSMQRKSRKHRSISPNASWQQRSQQKIEAFPENLFDLSYDAERVATSAKPAQPTETTAPPHDLSSRTSLEPRIRVLNPVLAYKWFHTVRCSVFEHGRADLLLGHGCIPLEVASLLTMGWITFDECLEWANGRAAVGEGLVALADLNAKGIELRLAERTTRPNGEELRAFVEDWMRLKSLDDCAYDWALDGKDRKQHGPLGPALARLATPNELEGILVQIADPTVDPESIRLPDNLIAVLKPLLVSGGAHKRTEQDNVLTPDEEQVERHKRAEAVRSIEEPSNEELSDERDHDEVNLKSECDGSAPPCYTKTDPLMISSSPVPSPTLSGDLSPSTPSSTIITSPFEDPIHLKPLQPTEINLTRESDEIGGFSEDSDMEDSTAVWPCTDLPTTSDALALEFDFDSIPFICCEETDVEMLPAQELMAECELRVMAIDSYHPEPSVWYSSSATVIDSTILDDEMQDAVPILPPKSVWPVPRSSSIRTIDMQDAMPTPHTAPVPPLPQDIPDIVISSPPTFVPSPPTLPTPRAPKVVSQSQTAVTPRRPAVFSAPKPPLFIPRRQRANALLVPPAAEITPVSRAPVQRALQRSASVGALEKVLDTAASLPDYEDDDDKENTVALAGPSKAEVRTAPSSPVLASTSQSTAAAGEYVETDVSDSDSDDGSFVDHNENVPYESVCETPMIDDPQMKALFRKLGIQA